ncbi:hypothetical protein KR074_007102, partial [Drosophila pseudoananassae]
KKKTEEMRSFHKFGFFHKRSELMIMLPEVPKLRDIFELFAVKVNSRKQTMIEGPPAESGTGEGAHAGEGIQTGEGEVGPGAGTGGQSNITTVFGVPTIDFSDVAECLRTMGVFPSEQWLSPRLDEQLRRREAMGTLNYVARRASFELVLMFYCQLATLSKKLTADEVLGALRNCDPQGTGILSYSELRHMLTTVCEPLEEAEVFSLLHSVSDVNGNVHYEHLVKKIFDREIQIEEMVHQARLYLQAVGPNAIDLDMFKRDEFIDGLREADPSNTGYIDQSILLNILNRNEQLFTCDELKVLTTGMEDEGHTGINYRRFLRFITHE